MSIKSEQVSSRCPTKPYTLLAFDDDPQSLVILPKILTAEYEVLLARSVADVTEVAQLLHDAQRMPRDS
ncbi:hypothetical protein ACF8MH_24335 [Pseudomonas sp. YQ_13]|uniref:hypothetical protein n=1 Tax=Pseudomonas sp. YQ_13 TaxID=3367235 RepID=UPI00370A24C2